MLGFAALSPTYKIYQRAGHVPVGWAERSEAQHADL